MADFTNEEWAYLCSIKNGVEWDKTADAIIAGHKPGGKLVKIPKVRPVKDKDGKTESIESDVKGTDKQDNGTKPAKVPKAKRGHSYQDQQKLEAESKAALEQRLVGQARGEMVGPNKYSQRYNYETYQYDYYCGSQAKVFFGDIWVDDIVTIQYNIRQTKEPIYSYASQNFDAVAEGTVLGEGMLAIAFKEVGYFNVIRAYMEEQKVGTLLINGSKTGQSGAEIAKQNILTRMNIGDTTEVTTGIVDSLKITGNYTPGLIRQSETIEEVLDILKNASTKDNPLQIERSGKTPNNNIDFHSSKYTSKDFEDATEVLEDLIWGDSNGVSLDLKNNKKSQILRADEFDYIWNGRGENVGILSAFDDNYEDVFNILITYGDISDKRAEHTLTMLNDVHFTGQSVQVSPTGEPIAEIYNFLFRDINKSINRNSVQINDLVFKLSNTETFKLSSMAEVEELLNPYDSIYPEIILKSYYNGTKWEPLDLTLTLNEKFAGFDFNKYKQDVNTALANFVEQVLSQIFDITDSKKLDPKLNYEKFAIVVSLKTTFTRQIDETGAVTFDPKDHVSNADSKTDAKNTDTKQQITMLAERVGEDGHLYRVISPSKNPGQILNMIKREDFFTSTPVAAVGATTNTTPANQTGAATTSQQTNSTTGGSSNTAAVAAKATASTTASAAANATVNPTETGVYTSNGTSAKNNGDGTWTLKDGQKIDGQGKVIPKQKAVSQTNKSIGGNTAATTTGSNLPVDYGIDPNFDGSWTSYMRPSDIVPDSTAIIYANDTNIADNTNTNLPEYLLRNPVLHNDNGRTIDQNGNEWIFNEKTKILEMQPLNLLNQWQENLGNITNYFQGFDATKPYISIAMGSNLKYLTPEELAAAEAEIEKNAVKTKDVLYLSPELKAQFNAIKAEFGIDGLTSAQVTAYEAEMKKNKESFHYTNKEYFKQKKIAELKKQYGSSVTILDDKTTKSATDEIKKNNQHRNFRGKNEIPVGPSPTLAIKLLAQVLEKNKGKNLTKAQIDALVQVEIHKALTYDATVAARTQQAYRDNPNLPANAIILTNEEYSNLNVQIEKDKNSFYYVGGGKSGYSPTLAIKLKEQFLKEHKGENLTKRQIDVGVQKLIDLAIKSKNIPKDASILTKEQTIAAEKEIKLGQENWEFSATKTTPESTPKSTTKKSGSKKSKIVIKKTAVTTAALEANKNKNSESGSNVNLDDKETSVSSTVAQVEQKNVNVSVAKVNLLGNVTNPEIETKKRQLAISIAKSRAAGIPDNRLSGLELLTSEDIVVGENAYKESLKVNTNTEKPKELSRLEKRRAARQEKRNTINTIKDIFNKDAENNITSTPNVIVESDTSTKVIQNSAQVEQKVEQKSFTVGTTVPVIEGGLSEGDMNNALDNRVIAAKAKNNLTSTASYIGTNATLRQLAKNEFFDKNDAIIPVKFQIKFDSSKAIRLPEDTYQGLTGSGADLVDSSQTPKANRRHGKIDYTQPVTDKSGGFKQFAVDLTGREGDATSSNPISLAMGMFQFIPSTYAMLTGKSKSEARAFAKKYRNNPSLRLQMFPESEQWNLMNKLTSSELSDVEKNFSSKLGAKVAGVELTESGLVAGEHFVGPGDLKHFINSGGTSLPHVKSYYTKKYGSESGKQQEQLHLKILKEYIFTFGGFNLNNSGVPKSAAGGGASPYVNPKKERKSLLTKLSDRQLRQENYELPNQKRLVVQNTDELTKMPEETGRYKLKKFLYATRLAPIFNELSSKSDIESAPVTSVVQYKVNPDIAKQLGFTDETINIRFVNASDKKTQGLVTDQSSSQNTLFINENAFKRKNYKNLEGVIAHELQHIIQKNNPNNPLFGVNYNSNIAWKDREHEIDAEKAHFLVTKLRQENPEIPFITPINSSNSNNTGKRAAGGAGGGLLLGASALGPLINDIIDQGKKDYAKQEIAKVKSDLLLTGTDLSKASLYQQTAGIGSDIISFTKKTLKKVPKYTTKAYSKIKRMLSSTSDTQSTSKININTTNDIKPVIPLNTKEKFVAAKLSTSNLGLNPELPINLPTSVLTIQSNLVQLKQQTVDPFLPKGFRSLSVVKPKTPEELAKPIDPIATKYPTRALALLAETPVDFPLNQQFLKEDKTISKNRDSFKRNRATSIWGNMLTGKGVRFDVLKVPSDYKYSKDAFTKVLISAIEIAEGTVQAKGQQPGAKGPADAVYGFANMKRALAVNNILPYDTQISTLPVIEVLHVQEEMIHISYRYGYATPASPVGRSQIIKENLQSLITAGVVGRNEIFDSGVQERATKALLERRGLTQFLSGNISAKKFATNLGLEWSSLKAGKNDTGAYAGIGQAGHFNIYDVLINFTKQNNRIQR